MLFVSRQGRAGVKRANERGDREKEMWDKNRDRKGEMLVVTLKHSEIQ